jgi:hypothetical protein
MMRILRKKEGIEGSGNLAGRWHTGVMANPEHLAKLKKGVEAWNKWRIENPKTRPDLSGASLIGAILNKADLNAAILNGADLIGAKLIGTGLRGANLIGAKLNGANLNGTDLSWACLNNANLGAANLLHANFRRAELDQADFTVARAGHATFADVDLSTAIGLETIVHSYPSTIGIDTIYKSKGKIPHIFLREAGVPENFIQCMASLVGTGIEFYSLFISYSTHDQEFADRLYADLQANGVRCWFAPHDMRSGKKVHEQIDEAIRVYDKLLLILSPESMASEWVGAEIYRAHEREVREGKRILFPIRLCSFEALRDWKLIDGDTGKDLAREIREYFIPDFSNWKDHDAYKRAFDRLLKDLQGKPDPSPA